MHRTGRTLAACLLAAALLPAALAGLEGGAIRGRVLLAPGREAASEVLITVSPVRPETLSGPDGAFVIPSLPAGRYTLRFQRTGLVSREIIVDVGPGETAELDVLLEPTRLTLHEEITVTAERGLEASFESPAAVNTLAARDLAGQWPRTAPEMLPEAPGVWLQKTNHGGGSPFVRGLTGNQVLTLVDGIRLNNSTYRYGPNQYINTIDPYSLDRIEVLRGGVSTLYGSDAIGGTLHFLSASPGLAAAGTEFHAAGRGKLAGEGMESSGRLDLRLRTPQWGLIGGVSLRSFGDLRAGGGLGVQSPSGYDETAANLKGLFKLGDELLLTAAFQSVRQPEVPAYDQVAQRGYARYVFRPQERHLSYLRLTSFSSKPLWREIEATVSWQESDEGRERQKEASDLVVAERDRVTTLGLQFRLRSEPRSAWSLTTGVDIYSDLVRSAAAETDLATGTTVEKRGLYPDRAKAFDLAIYHAQSLDVRRFGLRAGVRCDLVSIRARDGFFGDTSISPAALAGHFSALYRVSGTLHAVFNLSRSFRAPNINNLSTFGLFDYGIEVPVPGLRPEYGTTMEAGAKSKGDRWAWALYVYRTRPGLREESRRHPGAVPMAHGGLTRGPGRHGAAAGAQRQPGGQSLPAGDVPARPARGHVLHRRRAAGIRPDEGGGRGVHHAADQSHRLDDRRAERHLRQSHSGHAADAQVGRTFSGGIRLRLPPSSPIPAPFARAVRSNPETSRIIGRRKWVSSAGSIEMRIEILFGDETKGLMIDRLNGSGCELPVEGNR